MDRRAELAERLRGVTLQIGVPAYNEGRTILPTLRSLGHAAAVLGITPLEVILSDSSDTTETVDTAEAWAAESGVKLIVDRSPVRRHLKDARNVIYEAASADILIQVDADVVVPVSSLFHMLMDLTGAPRPEVAVGLARPDPAYRSPGRRAGTYQLNVNGRIASSLPPDAIRAEGAFYGTWRSFYSTYRSPAESGQLVDDEALRLHLEDRGVPTANSWRAAAYKVPPSDFREFAIQTHRHFASRGGFERHPRDFLAAAIEALRDPLGAATYAMWRARAAWAFRHRAYEYSEFWPYLPSTKR